MLNWGVCGTEGFLVWKRRVCWTEGFFMWNWGVVELRGFWCETEGCVELRGFSVERIRVLCWIERFLVFNWGVCWTEGFLVWKWGISVLNWGILGAEKVWPRVELRRIKKKISWRFKLEKNKSWGSKKNEGLTLDDTKMWKYVFIINLMFIL